MSNASPRLDNGDDPGGGGPGVDLDTGDDSDPGPDLEPCAACGARIRPDAEVCPRCLNRPARTAKWIALGLMAAGFVITLTGIGAILGISLFLLGLAARFGVEWTHLSPTEYAWGWA